MYGNFFNFFLIFKISTLQRIIDSFLLLSHRNFLYRIITNNSLYPV